MAFFLAFSFFFLSLSNVFFLYHSFPPRTSASVCRKGSPSSSWRWRRRCYRRPVDTYHISRVAMTGWVMTWIGRRAPLLKPVGKPVLNCQNLATWFSYVAIWWINSKVPEGLMITSGTVAQHVKSRLNSTGHSDCTSEVRDIFDRQTYVPNDWWQLMCSNVLQPWDRRNSMTAPVRNITMSESNSRGGAFSVVVIIVGNGISDASSNPG